MHGPYGPTESLLVYTNYPNFLMTEKAPKGRENVPTIFVIFGITGDLAHRKLIPALFSLYKKKDLPDAFKIVGFSRSVTSQEDLLKVLNESLDAKGIKKDPLRASFLAAASFIQGNFSEVDSYARLHAHLEELDEKIGQCTNKLFYLAVPPSLYETIAKNLSVSGLTLPCDDKRGWTRVLVEKPFGNNLATAKKLDALFGRLFKEEQIFRIDHYLAKETVQNILTFRFVNTIFEPLWNAKHIEKISIELHEKDVIGDRGAFYDTTGALRDVGQNHLLQLLAIIAMEKPKEFTPKLIREKRAEVLAALKPLNGRAFTASFDRAQYSGYRSEHGVHLDSTTETYFRLKLYLLNKRFEGVPFVLEAGKAMRDSRVRIVVSFKNDACVCEPPHERHINQLVFNIQPAEGIALSFWVKKPGFEDTLEQQVLSFEYDKPKEGFPDAYERLLHDAVRGDQTLFASTEEVQAAWKFITPILTGIEKVPLLQYDKGSDGPSGVI